MSTDKGGVVVGVGRVFIQYVIGKMFFLSCQSSLLLLAIRRQSCALRLLVQLFHARHKLQKVLHSNQLAVKFVMTLSEPNLKECCNVLKYAQETDEDWVQYSRPERYSQLIVQY